MDQDTSANYQIEWLRVRKHIDPACLEFDLSNGCRLSALFRDYDHFWISINPDNPSVWPHQLGG